MTNNVFHNLIRSLRRRLPGYTPPDDPDNEENRRDLIWLILLLLLLIIPVVLCGPTLFNRLRRGPVVDNSTQEPLDTDLVATEPAAGTRSDSDPGASTDCQDCPEEELEFGTGGTEEPVEPPEECDAACQDELGGACTDDGICSPEEAPTCKDCSSGNGACNSSCIYSAQCSPGLNCDAGICWDDVICTPSQPPVSSGDAPDLSPEPEITICVDNGGVQWQGEVCACSNVVDIVTICVDGTKVDTLTEIACTPDPQSCDPGGGQSDGGSGDCSAVGQVCNKTPAFGACPSGYTCSGPFDEFDYGTCQKAGCP